MRFSVFRTGLGCVVRFDLHPHRVRKIPDQLPRRGATKMAAEWDPAGGDSEERVGRLQHPQLV